MIQNLVFYFVASLIFIGCSATSIDSRYERKSGLQKKESVKPLDIPKEDFDFTLYKTKLYVDENNKTNENALDIWLGYDNVEKETLPTNIKKANGFRILVNATDNLEEAEELRAELYFKANQRAIYIAFDSPYYKVKVGDFLNRNDAKETNFKLNQLGFSNTVIISDSINIFK